MPFHFFHAPPPPHILPIVLTAALAIAAGIALARKRTVSARAVKAKPRHELREAPSENPAFEDYRRTTLAHLEQEAEEFRAFLQRLRHSEDKAAFDAFLKDRGRSPR